MKRKSVWMTVAGVLLLLVLLFSFVGCQNIISLEEIEIINEANVSSYGIGEFKYSDYTLLLHYSDGTTAIKTLTEDMISDYDKMQLRAPGIHTLSITYEFKTVTFTVTVERKKIVTDEEAGTVAPFLMDTPVTYDGLPHSLEVGGDVPEGATVTYTGEGNTFTEVGTYPVCAIIQADGYETITLNATLTITPATYVFDDFRMEVNYGVGTDGKPLEEFVYDGQPHGVTLAGSYPAELGEPKLEIMDLNNASEGYTLGSSAVNAGFYRVCATFSGDSRNYTTDNLTYTCDFKIAKQPVSREDLAALKFDDVVVDYDGKSHRIILGNVKLPSDVSVGYYEEDGKTPFVARTDVNEDGYVVICKFLTDNPNIEITETKTARLYIMPVNYVNVDQLHIGFLDESTAQIYDGTAHQLKVFGLNKNVTVNKFVWHKSETEDVEITSLTDVCVDNGGKTAAYRITAYFNAPADGNHLAIDPIDGELTILPTSFNPPQYVFESVTEAYSENATYSLTYTELYLPVGMKTKLEYTATGTVEKTEGLPQITCLPYDPKKQDANYGVGTYTCTLSFIYNPANYKDAPASIANAVAILEITERVYDAENIIGVKDVRTTYEAGTNRLPLCRFSEALPSWVDENYLTVAKLAGDDTELYRTEDAGTYEYFFRFGYFNGTEPVMAESKRGTLKIVGLQIHDKYYSATHGTGFTYDDVTDCLPMISGTADTPTGLTYKCKYTFTEPGSNESVEVCNDTFDLIYVDVNNGEKCALQNVADCVAKAKCAGTHAFEITISGKNFEPLSVSFTITVQQAETNISHAQWNLKSAAWEYFYDGKAHPAAKDATDIFVTMPPADEMSRISWTSKLKSTGNGIDVGTYTYTLVFSCINPNYTVKLETGVSFDYTVKIMSRDVKEGFTGGTESENYSPVMFNYYASGTQERIALAYDNALTARTALTYKPGDAVYEYAKLYGTKVAETEYSLNVRQLQTQDNAENPWFSAKNLEIYHVGTNDVTTGDAIVNQVRPLINKAFTENVKILVIKDDGTVLTHTGMVPDGEAAPEELGVLGAGQYTVLVVLPNDNILIEGSRVLAFSLKIRAIEPKISDPRKDSATDASVIVAKMTTDFDGFTSIANASVLDPFKNCKMFVYETTVDGNKIVADIFRGANVFDKTQMAGIKTYLVRENVNGKVVYVNTSQTVTEFDPASDTIAMGDASAYTEAGYYYLFVDLGENAVYTINGVPSRRFVMKVCVKPRAVTTSDSFALKASDGTVYSTTGTRKYMTDADKVTYKYGTEPIAGVDAVEATQNFVDVSVYTYEEIYSGKKLGIELLPGVPAKLRENLKFTVQYAPYAFQDGGATLGALYEDACSYGLKISYSQAQKAIAELYSTQAAASLGNTSVGLYYVFIKVESTDVNLSCGQRFVITVKIDRDNKDSQYQYPWKSATYNMRSTTLPYPKTAVEYKPDTYVYFDTLSQLRAQLQTVQNVAVSFDGTLSMEMSSDYKNVIGTHDVTVTFRFDTERFGGYQIVTTAPIFEIKKQNFTLSPLTALQDAYFYNPTSIDLSSVISDYREEMQGKLENLGLSATDAATLTDANHLTFRFNDGANSYDSVTDYGEYTVYPVFTLSKTEDLYLRYNFVTGTAFTATDSGTSVSITPNTVKFGNLSVKKAKILLAEGYSAGWANHFASKADFNDKQKVVENTYLFIGFYTKRNDFKDSLAVALTATEIADFIDKHVTATSEDNINFEVTLDLGTDAKYYDIWINYWVKTGEHGGQADGKVEKTYIYTGTMTLSKAVYVREAFFTTP